MVDINCICHRLQAAKQDAGAIFPFGEGIKRKVPSSFKRKCGRGEEKGCEMKRISKLDKEKAEAMEEHHSRHFLKMGI